MLKSEMLLFKETELRNLRIAMELELNDKHEKMMDGGQKHYLHKLTKLQEREQRFYKILEDKTKESEKEAQKNRLQRLKDMESLKQKEEDISRERLARIADLERKREDLVTQENGLLKKTNELESLKVEVNYEREMLAKKRKKDHILKNMEDMAIETAHLREEIVSRERIQKGMGDRMDNYQKENSLLIAQNSDLQQKLRSQMGRNNELKSDME